ncbi:hypothetical protein LX73_1568 [Fodinibius salinus]|uniref:Phage shock protein B n=1 Tax=Fodinibius salinus TaxID=860790 RepID=A0A5D3YK37_9BACT|nr:hypothetical protein [Fodinibius salinus]TYP93855.1 hypothetical protein LX73_1568 [Fodinibius salinus]
MTVWIFLIVLVSIIGGLAIEYQRNKLEIKNKSRQNEEEVEDLRKLINSLKKRIENLEAIAAGEPDDFKTGAGTGMSEIEIEEEPSVKEQNQQKVSDIADKRRNK